MKNNLIKYYRTSSKKRIQLDPSLNEIIIGCLLGDLTIERKTVNNNARLQYKQSIINKEYINHLYSLFNPYCGSKPIELSRFDNRINKNKIYYSIKFQTLSLNCFNKYRELYYNIDGIKIIPKSIIDEITVKSLAY